MTTNHSTPSVEECIDNLICTAINYDEDSPEMASDRRALRDAIARESTERERVVESPISNEALAGLWRDRDALAERVRVLEEDVRWLLAKFYECDFCDDDTGRIDDIDAALAHTEPERGWDEAVKASAQLAETRAEVERLTAIINEGPDCLDGCDSVMHEDLCPNANPREAWAALRAKVAAGEELFGKVERWLDEPHIHYNSLFEARAAARAAGLGGSDE